MLPLLALLALLGVGYAVSRRDESGEPGEIDFGEVPEGTGPPEQRGLAPEDFLGDCIQRTGIVQLLSEAMADPSRHPVAAQVLASFLTFDPESMGLTALDIHSRGEQALGISLGAVANCFDSFASPDLLRVLSMAFQQGPDASGKELLRSPDHVIQLLEENLALGGWAAPDQGFLEFLLDNEAATRNLILLAMAARGQTP